MSWFSLVKAPQLPSNEMAFLGMLSQDETAQNLIDLVNQEDTSKRGMGKKKFKEFVQNYSANSSDSFFASLEPSSRNIFSAQKAKIYKNFLKVRKAVGVRASRASYGGLEEAKNILSDEKLQTKENILALYSKFLRKSQNLDKLSREELQSLEKNLEKYAEEPKNYRIGKENLLVSDKIVDYGYALLQFAVRNPPKSEISGFITKNGPSDSVKIFERIVKLENLQSEADKFIKNMEKGQEDFEMLEDNNQQDGNFRKLVQQSKKSEKMSNYFGKTAKLKFTTKQTISDYKVSDIRDSEVRAYLELLTVSKPSILGIETRPFTRALEVRLGPENDKISIGKPIPIIVQKGKTYTAINLFNEILTSAYSGSKAFSQAFGTSRGRVRRSKAKDKIGSTQKEIESVPDKVKEILEIGPEEDAVGELEFFKENPEMLEESQLEELKELSPRFDEDELNLEVFITSSTVSDFADVPILQILREYAKENDMSLADTLFEDVALDEISTQTPAKAIIAYIQMLIQFTGGQIMEMSEKLPPFGDNGKEGESSDYKTEADAFMSEFNKETDNLKESLKKAIKDKLQDIIDNPRKYPELYGITSNEKEISIESLPKVLFNYKTTEGVTVQFIKEA